MMQQWRATGSLSWRAAMLAFTVAGLVLLALAARDAAALRTELTTWPIVRARVDSATVASPAQPRQERYAPRLWLTYTVGGRTYTGTADAAMHAGTYERAVRAARAAARAGHATVLVSPRDVHALSLDPGYNWRFFVDPLLLGVCAIACWCLTAFFALTRQRPAGEPAPRHTASASPGAGAFALAVGLLLVGGGIAGVARLREQSTTWPRVQALVDSADVVWRSTSSSFSRHHGLYAPRLWVTYVARGRRFHAPVISGAYRSGPDDATAAVNAARRDGRVSVLVDPDDPYDIVDRLTGSAPLLWHPALFALLGLGCVALGVTLLRAGRGAGELPPSIPTPRHESAAGTR